MEKIRKGKDFIIEWPVLTNGDPVPLAGRDLRLELHAPGNISMEVPFSVNGIDVLVRISPQYQPSLGTYRFTLWENYGKDGQTMVDSCDAFYLVNSTCKEGTSGCGCSSNIKTHHVKLTIGDMTFSPIIINGGGNVITVDDALSTTSTNPVQNKVITAEVNEIKEDVDDNTENIEDALEQSQKAHQAATKASMDVAGLSQIVTDLSDKVDKTESGEIVWNDVE